MRPIHIVHLEKPRPAVVLTRPGVRDRMSHLTVVPITSTAKGLSVEVPVGPRNGIDHSCVVNCDNIETVPVDRIGRQVGFLLDDQEEDLARAISTAFDLEDFGLL
ncbi:type II toxin-antitoxin system PemK/MazF family toxin [Isoptericola sp. NPDC019482]|uniref:type II toxin-antitoxin system PemK/MazF family toxin n=1 Tax=Isoptericola sp. NPDC019482 TaxID=3154688 RepID=UPI00346B83A2